MPGCNIEMFEPVSIIKTLSSSISTEIEGAPCSNATESAGLMTIYFGVKAGGAVFLHALLPFPELFYYFLESCLVGVGVFLPEDSKRLERSVWFFLPGCWELPCSHFNLAGHSLAKCPIPSHL